MESIRDLRIRIKSIKSTKQITDSMRLIATRKVLKTRKRMEDNRLFATQNEAVKNLMLDNPDFSESAYIKGREPEKSLIILITGDRGLCAGYNVNASKEGRALGRKLKNSVFITVGKKGNDYLRRRHKPIIKSYRGISENPFYEDAQSIASLALKMYNDKEIDQLYVVYTSYESMLNLIPTSQQILPLKRTNEPADNVEEAGMAVDLVTRYDSDGDKFLPHAVEMYVASVIFGGMLESSVCEQAARVMGMDTASKNCDKIVETLNLQYNQMRQSAITQEIAEIVSGAGM